MPRDLRQRANQAAVKCVWAAAVFIACTFARVAPAQQGTAYPPPGKWLLDYGMRHGLLVTSPKPADAAFVLAWLDAAMSVTPDLPEAYLWKYDLLIRLNQADAALNALRGYCHHAPRDLSAALNLIGVEFERAQTVETRIDICNNYLQSERLPREIASDLHRRLAGIYVNIADAQNARIQAELAVKHFPQNLPARSLLAEIEGRLRAPATQIELLLNEVAVNPASTQVIWRIARTLDALSMHVEALEWYELTVKAFVDEAPDAHLPIMLLFELAQSHFDNDDYDETIEYCNRILAQQPSLADVTVLLIRAARQLALEELVERHSTALAGQFRELETQAIEQHNAILCRQIAEFHLDIRPDPRRALQFALLADRYQPGDAATRRALGAAYLELDKAEEAVQTLAPLAMGDQRAALTLARAQESLENPGAALATLRAAERIRFSGAAYREIVQRLVDLNETPVPAPDRADVAAVLAGFDRGVLRFANDVADLLEFEVQLGSNTCPIARTILARYSLTNRGPYAVTLGEDRMVNPNVSVSFSDTSHQGITLQNDETVSIDGRYVLDPGESIEVIKPLAIPTDKLRLEHQPQRKIVLDITFILDPVLTEHGLTSSLAGVRPVTHRVTRSAVDASRKGMKQIAAQLHDGDEFQRITAVETLFSLTVERRASMLDKPHTYAAVTLNADELTAMILGALKDPSPIVRTHAVCALLRLPLTDETLNASAKQLSDPNWLPRLVAAEMFANLQGPTFLPVLERLSEDPNPTVALLARLRRNQAVQFKQAVERQKERRAEQVRQAKLRRQ